MSKDEMADFLSQSTLTAKISTVSKNGICHYPSSMVCTGSRRYYFYYMEVERKHRDTLIENTGVEPSLTEEEMKGYLEQVLNEMERTSSKRNR